MSTTVVPATSPPERVSSKPETVARVVAAGLSAAGGGIMRASGETPGPMPGHAIGRAWRRLAFAFALGCAVSWAGRPAFVRSSTSWRAVGTVAQAHSATTRASFLMRGSAHGAGRPGHTPLPGAGG